jgi:hypothetical protein
MIFKWESEKQRLSKFMGISPKKKLEWLQEMHDFLCSAIITKKQRRNFYRLRESR